MDEIFDPLDVPLMNWLVETVLAIESVDHFLRDALITRTMAGRTRARHVGSTKPQLLELLLHWATGCEIDDDEDDQRDSKNRRNQ